MPLDIVSSVCPHDCPSACALEVERHRRATIGRVRGADGAVLHARASSAPRSPAMPSASIIPTGCRMPLRRVGEKGVGRDAFAPISWDDALDEVAERLTRAAQRHGSETVWPLLLCRHDGAGAARRHQPAAPRDALFARSIRRSASRCPTPAGSPGSARSAASTAREIAKSDLIVVWGGNPVSTQVNVMTHIATARKERGAKLVVVDPYRTAHRRAGRPASGAAARHRRRARLRGHACAVQGGLRRPRLPGALHRRPRRARSASRDARPGLGGARSPALPKTQIVDFARLYGAHQAQLYPARLRLFALAQRRGADLRRDLPAGGDRRLAIRGRRRALFEPRPRCRSTAP